MSRIPIMTIEEEAAIMVKAIELKKQGKLEESEHLRKQIPLQPYLAKIAKKYFGSETLKKTGWNLSEAEAEFGPDWLSK